MKYFGTDGIRGIPGETISYDLVKRIGMSLYVLGHKDVLIATDTRASKDAMTNALIEGIKAVGLDVYLLGVLPTPALIYQSLQKKAIGVMITASHNPYKDNGIKIVNCGYKLTSAEESKLEYLIDNPKEKNIKSNTYVVDNSLIDYIEFISNYIEKSNLSIAIDCANGATFQSAPIVFSKITNKLIITSNTPNGYNINDNCGSTHLSNISKIVIDNNCDIGFAYDGDGDRVLCVDRLGRRIDGDIIIYILAKYLNKINELKNNSVVLTIMSNLGIIEELKKNQIKAIEANVGDKYVINEMNINNISLGGENSGHIILSDYFHTGDGLLTSIILIKALSTLNTTLEKELDSISLYSDKMINVKVSDRNKVMNYEPLFKYREEIINHLNNDCKVIIRPSGTEDLIRVSVMAKEESLVEYYSNNLVNIIKSIK